MSESQQHSQSPSAGWYPDPSQAGMNRYWDGDGWSEQVAPAASHGPSAVRMAPGTSVYPPGTVPPPSKSHADKLAVWGYVTAVIFPIVGAILGARLLRMGDKRGNTILIIAAAVFVLVLIATLTDSSSANAFTGLE